MDREKIENNRETIEKDRLENISRKILVMARNELYMKMRCISRNIFHGQSVFPVNRERIQDTIH